MILAEIADKMAPMSIFIGAAIVTGVCLAMIFASCKGCRRSLGLVIAVGAVLLLHRVLRVDADLIEATRSELGQDYLVVSQYWIAGAVAMAVSVFLTLRRYSLNSRRLCQPKSGQTDNPAPQHPA